MTCAAACIQPSPSQAHCGSSCHRTFGSVSSFDRHRRRGECLDPAGLAMHPDDRGIWRWDVRASNTDPRPPSWGEPQAAERASGVLGYGSGDSVPADSRSGGPA